MSIELESPFAIEFPKEPGEAAQITNEQQEQFLGELYGLQLIATMKTRGLSLVVTDIPELEDDVKALFNNIRQQVGGHLQGRGRVQLGTRMGLNGIMAVPDGSEFSIRELEEGVHIEGIIGGSALELLPDVEGEFDSVKQRVTTSVMIRLREVKRVLTDVAGEVVYTEPVLGDVYVPLAYSGVEPFLLPTEPVHGNFNVNLGGRVVDAYRSLFITEEQREMPGPQDFEQLMESLADQEIRDPELAELLNSIQTTIDLELIKETKSVNAMTPKEVDDFMEGVAPLIKELLDPAEALVVGMPFVTSGPGVIGVGEQDAVLTERQVIPNEHIIAGVVKGYRMFIVPSPKALKEHLSKPNHTTTMQENQDEWISFGVLLERARHFAGKRADGRPGKKTNISNFNIIIAATYRAPARSIRGVEL